jgi:hypothetical protein
VFFSKIWFFLVAVAAAIAITVALVMPRPAERATQSSEAARLTRACWFATMTLRDNARDRVDLAGDFAHAAAPPGSPRLKLDEILDAASRSERISEDAHATAKAALSFLVDKMKGPRPAFVVAVDRVGRVVARVGVDETEYGDSLAGYYLVDDALAGYMRDDTWYLGSVLYRVAAAPVVAQREGMYAGAVVLGHVFSKDLADGIDQNINAYISFYVAGQPVASSSSAQIHKDLVAHYEELAAQPPPPIGEEREDCKRHDPVTVDAGDKQYSAIVARLPGEAREQGAFYAVFVERPEQVGFFGTLRAVKSGDLTFGNFPWIPVALLFVFTVAVGILLMLFEADRPMRRLVKDTVRLAKGDAARLDELKHRGKTGSIARSVNIALDKLERDAKSAKRDLDSLLGPPPDDSPSASFNAAGAAAVAVAIPVVAPGGPSLAPFAPPPPSEFRFEADAAPRGGGGVEPVMASPESFEFDLPPPPASLADLPPLPTPSPPVHNPTHQQVPPPAISLPVEAAPARPPRAPPPTPAATTNAGVPRPAGRPTTGPTRRTSGPTPSLDSISDDILGDDGPPVPPPLPPPVGATPPTSPQLSPFDTPTRVSDASRELLEQSAAPDDEGDEFRRVFDEFATLKRQCGEPTDSLTYKKFVDKLRKNRDALMAKHGCRSVKFQVYIKDGKAALKATPLK